MYFVPIVYQDDIGKKEYAKVHTEYEKYYHILYS